MTGDWMDLFSAQLWQVTAVAVFAWLLAETCFRNAPRMQSAVWAVVLLKCLVPPLAPSLICPELISGPSVWDRSAGVERAVSTGVSDMDVVVEIAHSSSSFSSSVAPSSALSASWQWNDVFVVVWLGGCLLLFVIVLVRVRWCHRQTHRVYAKSLASVSRVLDELSEICPKRLRVIVNRGQFGPAAMGPLRPVVVLPAALARRLGSEELRSVLTHELMHIRRGDLWWGWVQTAALCLFWFHPLVWLASRRMTFALEQCCDEDTIRWLRCEPVVYRRSLAATLLWKNSVPPLPFASAIRSASFTRSRMEALMKIDLSIPSSSLQSKLTLLILAVLILPGARWPVSATPPSQERLATIPPAEPSDHDESAADQPEPESDAVIKWFAIVYRLSDLLILPQDSGAEALGDFDRLVYLGVFDDLVKEIQSTVRPESWESAGGYGTLAPYPENFSIVISTTSEVHDEVSKFLKRKQESSPTSANAVSDSSESKVAQAVEFRIVLVTGPREDLAGLCEDWTNQENAASIVSQQAVLPSADRRERRQPLAFQTGVVAIEVAERLRRNDSRLGLGQRIQAVSAPRIRIPLRMAGMISIGEDHVVSFKDDLGREHKQVKWGGSRLSIRADLVDDRTHVALKWATQTLLNAETAPAVERRDVEVNTELMPEQAALVLRSSHEGDANASLLAIWAVE